MQCAAVMKILASKGLRLHNTSTLMTNLTCQRPQSLLLHKQTP
ncbi:hypothetical protein COO91_08689 [Nostoc flagelliforme CCNUN1]|uniref:Uncharacterized protein n=1 Tax=Nostoc flagelliforme CCNUN1 TaxID=2038116 RepID=A0A2K8T4B9_9NOSO|nr:hypothetical protein COO91_08689 [Nostoc flagelliforme CCNUN1]